MALDLKMAIVSEVGRRVLASSLGSIAMCAGGTVALLAWSRRPTIPVAATRRTLSGASSTSCSAKAEQTKFEQRIGRERHPLGGPQRCETVRRVAQGRLEGPNPEADQTPLHPVDKARALTDEPLALTARALGILLRQRRNGRHVAVIGFAAQPADEDPFEQSRVEAICFRPAMLARDSHAGRVDDVGFDIAGPEPARQPEAVAARLERDHDARNRAAFLRGPRTPAHEQTEQFHLAWFELLQRMALDPWNNASDEPACLAHLDDGKDRAVLVQGGEEPAQVVELLCHGTLHRRCFQRRW